MAQFYGSIIQDPSFFHKGRNVKFWRNCSAPEQRSRANALAGASRDAAPDGKAPRRRMRREDEKRFFTEIHRERNNLPCHLERSGTRAERNRKIYSPFLRFPHRFLGCASPPGCASLGMTQKCFRSPIICEEPMIFRRERRRPEEFFLTVFSPGRFTGPGGKPRRAGRRNFRHRSDGYAHPRRGGLKLIFT